MWTRICYGKKDMPFNYSEFICDTEDDLDSLPTNEKYDGGLKATCSIGSIATVIEPRKKYILNNQNKWEVLLNFVSTGSSDDTDTSSLDIASLEEVKEYLNI